MSITAKDRSVSSFPLIHDFYRFTPCQSQCLEHVPDASSVCFTHRSEGAASHYGSLHAGCNGRAGSAFPHLLLHRFYLCRSALRSKIGFSVHATLPACDLLTDHSAPQLLGAPDSLTMTASSDLTLEQLRKQLEKSEAGRAKLRESLVQPPAAEQ